MIISDPRRWPSTAAVAVARLVARTATVVRASSSPGERASYSRELKCRVDADECHNGWRWPPAVRRRPSSRWADLGALPGRETDALRANALSGGRAAWHTRAQVPRARQRAVSSAVQRGSQFLGSETSQDGRCAARPRAARWRSRSRAQNAVPRQPTGHDFRDAREHRQRAATKPRHLALKVTGSLLYAAHRCQNVTRRTQPRPQRRDGCNGHPALSTTTTLTRPSEMPFSSADPGRLTSTRRRYG